MKRFVVIALSSLMFGNPVLAQDMAARIQAVELVLSHHDRELMRDSQALSAALTKAIAAASSPQSRTSMLQSRDKMLAMQEAIVAAAETVQRAQPYMDAALAMDRQEIADRAVKDAKFQHYQLASGILYDQRPEVVAYRAKNREIVEKTSTSLSNALDKKAVDAVMRHDAALAIYHDKKSDVTDRASAFDYVHSSIGALKPLY